MHSFSTRSIARFMFVGVLFASSAVHSALFDRGGGLVYDSGLDVTWLADANYANTSGYTTSNGGRMTWDGAVAWADQLSFHGSVRNVDYTDWRLPTAVLQDFYATGSELAHLRTDLGGVRGVNLTQTANANFSLFTNVALNVNQGIYWPGNQYAPRSTTSLNFMSGYGTQEGYSTGPNATLHYGWAVRNGDVLSPIPEPQVYSLMLAGLAVVVFIARRRRRSPR